MMSARVCLATLLAFVLPAVLEAQVKVSKDNLRANPKLLKAFREVVTRPSESTVRILGDGTPQGLGVVVAPDGWIITKASVLEGKIVCQIKDGKDYPAKIVGVHEGFDLALLKVEAKDLRPIVWRNTKEVIPGSWVATVGTGTEPLAIGVVSVPTRRFRPGDQPPKNLSTRSGYLGVNLEDADGGARVKVVVKDSPADKAGLKEADIVVQAGTRPITDVESLINTVQRHKVGDTLALKVKRGTETLDLKATLGKLPKGIGGNPAEAFGSALSDRRGGFPVILQHDTVLQPKECGGPLVDLDGKAVGINIARAGRTESYAIPSEEVLALLDELKSGKLAVKTQPEQTTKQERDKSFLLDIAGELTQKDPLDKQRAKCHHKIHTVKLNAGEQYTIDLTSNEFDAFLRLEDVSGIKLAEDDDGGEELDARIIFNAPKDGVYRIVVTTFNAQETGGYTLTVRQTGGKK